MEKYLQANNNDWLALYEAANNFKEHKCWKWMQDTDLFAIEDKDNKETGFCVVLGNNQEIYALVVYLGLEGLQGYLRILSGEIGPYDLEMLHSQSCLMVSFEDKKCLDSKDLKKIRSLGFKYKGAKDWPLFRSYYPGYHPWYLNKREVNFLTYALKEAVNIAKNVRENPRELHKKNKYISLLKLNAESSKEWLVKWLHPASNENMIKYIPPLNELRIRRVQKNAKRENVVWETDIFYSPLPIQPDKNERPFYPYISIWVDSFTQDIIDYRLFKPFDYPHGYQNSLLDLIEVFEVLPIELCVKDYELAKILAPVANTIKIKTKVKESLPALESAKENIVDYFTSILLKEYS